MTNYFELYENGDTFFDVINEIKRKHLANTKENIIKRIRGIMSLEHDIRNVLKCDVSESFSKACESYGSKIYKEDDKVYFANRYSVNKIDALCEFIDPTSNRREYGWSMTPAAYNIKITVWREKDSHNAYYFVIRIDYTNSIIIDTIEEIKKWYALYEIDGYTPKREQDITSTIYQAFNISEENIIQTDENIDDRIRRIFNLDDVVNYVSKKENISNLGGLMDISYWAKRYNLDKFIDGMSLSDILKEKI